MLQLGRLMRENTLMLSPNYPRAAPIAFGAWGKTAGLFSQLAIRLAAQANSTQSALLNYIYIRLCLLLVLVLSWVTMPPARDLLEGYE